MFKNLEQFIRELYKNDEIIPLNPPCFNGNEKKYLLNCVDSTFVSSVGQYVNDFEKAIADFTGAKYAVATVNGTSALHMALLLAGVKPGDKVITQAFTFVATANAISYCGAEPIFIDVDKDTMGLSPEKLEDFLSKNNNLNIRACVPVHMYGHPTRIEEIVKICDKYNIKIIEDATESLGSTYEGKYTGTFGHTGILSFNGNKIITTGGGGMILTDNEKLARKAKHLTTTAKTPHQWLFLHDEVGYNYRLPNINAAIGVAQMEKLPEFISLKRQIASKYNEFFKDYGYKFVTEPKNCRSNYWLNVLLLKSTEEKEKFLKYFIDRKIMVRSSWTLLNRFSMYKNCLCDSLENSKLLENLAVNIPSGVSL